MMKITEAIYSFGINAIIIVSIAFSGLLFLASFLGTAFSTDMETQIVSFRFDNPLFNFLGLAFCICLCFFFYKFFQKKTYILFIITAITYLIAGGILILRGRTVPAADALSVFRIAESFAVGDLSAIHPTGSYLSYYPHQIGLTAFYEIIIRFWNLLPTSLSSFHFIKILNVSLAILTLFIVRKTITTLWENPMVDCCYLFLSLINLPFTMYTSFVYSEIPSYCFLSFGIYFIVFLWKKGKNSKKRQRILLGIASILCIALSIALRKNNLIPFIAICIVIFFQWIKEKKHVLLVYLFLLSACCLTILPVTQKTYELRANNYLSKGVTATSYFAMGMQEASRCSGWYNGFNFTTYEESGLDVNITNQKSREAIKEKAEYFKNNPKDCLLFYSRKILSQWIDGTYASRQATLATYGGRSDFFTSLYEGRLSLLYIEFCNIYQLILYFGIFIFYLDSFLVNKKEKKASALAFPLFIGTISIIGGFLFHIIWEANSRYILVYSLLMLPYSAKGMAVLWEFIDHKLIKKKSI